MSTLKQKIAARANPGKFSRPRHAMLATTFVFDEEHKDRFRELVETMAISRWRQMRLWGLEKNILMQEMETNDDSAGANTEPLTLPGRAAQAFRTLAAGGNGLQLILRHEAQSFRSFFRCLKTLNDLQENVPEIENVETNPISDFPEQNEQLAEPKSEPAELLEEAGPAPAVLHPSRDVNVPPDTCIPFSPSGDHEGSPDRLQSQRTSLSFDPPREKQQNEPTRT